MSAADGPTRAVVLLQHLRRTRLAPSATEFAQIDALGAELLGDLRKAWRLGRDAAAAEILGRVDDARAVVWPDGEPDGAAYVSAWAEWREGVAA